MILVDDIVKHFLEKLTRDPLKIVLSDYPYELYIYTKPKQEEKHDNTHPKTTTNFKPDNSRLD